MARSRRRRVPGQGAPSHGGVCHEQQHHGAGLAFDAGARGVVQPGDPARPGPDRLRRGCRRGRRRLRNRAQLRRRRGAPSMNAEREVRVAVFTAGSAAPSARFRVRQYVGPLAALGIELSETWPRLGAFPPKSRAPLPGWLAGTLAQGLGQVAASRDADITLLQREMVSTLPTIEGLTRRPRVVDIDDSVHLRRGGWAARRLAAGADLVVVGNCWLAEIWRPWNRSVEILATPVDTERYAVRPLPNRPTIGWIGSADNLHYLADIAPALERVVARFPETEIAVCCDRPPELGRLPVRYVPWSTDAEGDFLGSISIGV